MEILDSILELTKVIFAPIGRCIYHREAGDYMRILTNDWQVLRQRKLDVEAEMRAEHFTGKTPKQEVVSWLQKVERMENEIQAIERRAEAGVGKCFSRAHVRKLAFKKMGEVEELNQKAVFTNGFFVDPPPCHEEILSTPILIGESIPKGIKEDIWACIMDNNVKKIGVYGMGGIGKTTVMKHINNLILKEKKYMFDTVIWVTVSRAFNVIQLQHNIACNLDLDLQEVEHVKAKLEDKERYVLILDDMWEAFDLEKVEIPEPTSSNGCKLVLTTRLLDVCQGMSCKTIKMELLLQQEAQNLFLDILGLDVFNTPNLKAIAEKVIERCAGLPLAIVTIAGSLKGVIHDSEWRDALEELRTPGRGSDNIASSIFERLAFSYKRLKDEELQQCLLHCALYPKYFKIRKRELIEHLIDKGIIERNSRQEEFDRGYSMLQKLENACLLEGEIDEYEKLVTKPVLVRDMVLWVASPQFKVEDHLELEDFSYEGKWREDLVKASLMYNNISRIPPNVSPMCPKLSTLLLQGNWSLKDVPNSLFEHLHGLNLLDLSNTAIESLPNSISNLENLTTLRLGGCRCLNRVPLLAKLTKLRKLDLWRTRITEVPDGLEMLVNLRYLDLNAERLKIMPPEILPKLSHLQ